MSRGVFLIFLGFAGASCFHLGADEGDVIFRSDVSLVRVDAQVVDRANRAIIRLKAQDFILREDGRPRRFAILPARTCPWTSCCCWM